MKTPTARYFQRRRSHPDSPFRCFVVRCLRCGSFKLRLVAEFNAQRGGRGTELVLVCPNCRQREIVPVK